MTSLEFFVPGTPVAQPRPRAVRRGKHAGVYDPGSADAWRAAVKWCAQQAKEGVFAGAVRLDLLVYFNRPKSHFRKNGTLKPSAPKHHDQKPDKTNIEKAIEDALTDAGVWCDDCQIVDGGFGKRWCKPEDTPGCYVLITPLES